MEKYIYIYPMNSKAIFTMAQIINEILSMYTYLINAKLGIYIYMSMYINKKLRQMIFNSVTGKEYHIDEKPA